MKTEMKTRILTYLPTLISCLLLAIAFPIKRQEITVFAFYDAKRYMNI